MIIKSAMITEWTESNSGTRTRGGWSIHPQQGSPRGFSVRLIMKSAMITEWTESAAYLDNVRLNKQQHNVYLHPRGLSVLQNTPRKESIHGWELNMSCSRLRCLVSSKVVSPSPTPSPLKYYRIL